MTVLDRLGLEIEYPETQTCCGQPAFNNGYRQVARTLAERFVTIFEDAPVVVAPSGSCVAMVRKHYLELFRDKPTWFERAERLSTKIFEFSEFLVKVLGTTHLGSRFPHKVTYHDSCSVLRSIGVRDEPRALIRAVEGIDFIELEEADRCCGFGGTFAVKFADLSAVLLEDKVENIRKSGAEFVVGCEISCLMNIECAIRRQEIPTQTMHLAELLAQT